MSTLAMCGLCASGNIGTTISWTRLEIASRRAAMLWTTSRTSSGSQLRDPNDKTPRRVRTWEINDRWVSNKTVRPFDGGLFAASRCEEHDSSLPQRISEFPCLPVLSFIWATFKAKSTKLISCGTAVLTK